MGSVMAVAEGGVAEDEGVVAALEMMEVVMVVGAARVGGAEL
jgi:hypothetical protein